MIAHHELKPGDVIMVNTDLFYGRTKKGTLLTVKELSTFKDQPVIYVKEWQSEWHNYEQFISWPTKLARMFYDRT